MAEQGEGLSREGGTEVVVGHLFRAIAERLLFEEIFERPWGR